MNFLNCTYVKRICDRLIVSTDVTFSDNTLVINIPSGVYGNLEKYCIVVAQAIPDETTITAPVAITIGDDITTTYPLLNCDCTPVYACSINTRTRYTVRVFTDLSSGVFRLLGKVPCSRCTSNLASLPVAETTATP